MADVKRVMVVDDSALMRKKIVDIINSDPELEVIATARDGKEAIREIVTLKPDVITMDIEMPRLDGLTALGYIMTDHPTPVVMLSAFAKEDSELTIKALQYGAVDFVTKPSGPVSFDIVKVKEDLLAKIKQAAEIPVDKLTLLVPETITAKKKKPKVVLKNVVVIGGSTGGPQALMEILPKLHANIEACFLIVQHMPAEYTTALARRLDECCEIKVKEAEDGDLIEAGTALVAPGGFNMEAGKRGAVADKWGGEEAVRLKKVETGFSTCTPQIDVTMESVAEIYRKRAIGVVLTGMGSDGTKGLAAIRASGGKTLVEDKSTSLVFNMPESAIQAGAADKVVPLYNVAAEIEGVIHGT
jgi:two-component system chemotaxis response regulator CheB